VGVIVLAPGTRGLVSPLVHTGDCTLTSEPPNLLQPLITVATTIVMPMMKAHNLPTYDADHIVRIHNHHGNPTDTPS